MAKRRTDAEYRAEVERQMKINHCTWDEAVDIVEWDDAIDGGDKELGAPTAEQKKVLRTVLKADRDPTAKKATTRERKIDDDKLTIFTLIQQSLIDPDISDLTCKNEAEISFSYKGSEYTVKLTKHRPKK